MRQILFILLAFVSIGCSGTVNENHELSSNNGDSITTIDSVSYYWQQISEDSAMINAVKDGEIINQCLVTGPVYSAIPTEDERFKDRFFLILCGEDQYELFDTRNIPSEFNILTEEDFD